jgi:hypothetical protein
MASPDPIQLLEEELDEHKRALDKSIKLYESGDLEAEVHVIHKERLKKLIDNYTYAIYILKEKKR